MSRQRRPLAWHAGKLSSWFHLFEWMWSDVKWKARRVAQNLHMLKFTIAMSCKRKNCGYLFFWAFFFSLIVSKWIIKTVLFAVAGGCYWKVRLSHLSVCCLKSELVYTFLWTAAIQKTRISVFALSNLRWFVARQSHTTSQEFALFPRRPFWQASESGAPSASSSSIFECLSLLSFAATTAM